MDAMTPLTVTLPMLDVDWETLVSVNLPTLLFVIVGVPLALVGYIVGLDVLVRRLPKRSQPSVRPWVWVAPAIAFVGLILVYPMIGTIVRSFFDRHGDTFVGLGNFVRLLTDHGILIVLRNNLLWLLLYPGLVILFGLWGGTGFAMLILSAALKGLPGELLEAARVYGANEMTVFRRIILPLMMPTIVVVGTTMVIFALKAFDVVYVMTAGNYNTDILARRMYAELYSAGNYANASALAVILLLAVVPVLIFNLRQFRAVEARR